MEWWIEEELSQATPPPRKFRRRPLLGMALAVVAGTAIGLSSSWPPIVFLGAAFAMLPFLFLWVAKPPSGPPMFLTLLFLCAAHGRMQTAGHSADSLATAIPRQMEYVRIAAVATEDAIRRPPPPGRRAEEVVFSARVEGLCRTRNSWLRMKDDIDVVLRNVPPDARLPRYGERWLLHGLVRPAVPRRSALFILPRNQALVDGNRAVFLDAGHGNPLKAWCMERRRVCSAVLGRGLDDFPEVSGILQALILGYRADLPAALREDFASTGTVHIFAISGAHVGMVLLMVMFLLPLVGVPADRCLWFAAPLLILYTLTTGAAVSAVRACVMALVMLAARVLHRRPDPPSSLALAAILILAVSPEQLGDLGFLLSFTAVAGMFAILPVLNMRTRNWFRRDPWTLPAQERPRILPRLGNIALWLFRNLQVSLATWLATAPLTAWFFNLFSPVALLMNLLVIPLAFCILLAGVLSLLLSFCPPVSVVFNHAAGALAWGLAWSIRKAALLPGGHWFVPTPPGALVMGTYAVLLGSAVWARRRKGALLGGVAIVAMAVLMWGWSEYRRCRVTVLDVGEGNAILVQAERQNILIDTGESFRAPNLLRALRRAGVNHLDTLALTHSDAAHTGNALWLLDQLPVRELWLPVKMWPSPFLNRILETAAARKIPLRRLAAGDSGRWPGALAWHVLWPSPSSPMACADDASLVLHIARYGASILLPGDLSASAESALLARGPLPPAAVLLASSHGSDTASSPAWWKALRPSAVLVSCGPHSAGQHPSPAFLERADDAGAEVWRTDTHGPLRMDFSPAIPRWPEPGWRLRPGR